MSEHCNCGCGHDHHHDEAQQLESMYEQALSLYNFDIKYYDAEGVGVKPDVITSEQRQKLADYYAYVIKSYMTKIPNDKQAGICKANMVDTGDPVGLWAIDTKSKDWVRTATYEAFCKALSGQ